MQFTFLMNLIDLFKIKDEVLLYLPSPPKGHNSKFHTPLRGVYTVVEKTSPLTYIVRKKGGRNKRLEIIQLYEDISSPYLHPTRNVF